ncbi:hypothetical protein TRFO_23287 [Tritrichomonas foetus]|uniref:Uncharacterized protein n=1 Tax=Tritrichomonas foetus TaxID=1144522 RepID=A0A1J4KBE2_9EUKA|nr:hypothetical protein TRFO_23287 [Tritrichomonas foetus]|eukprot:OHT08216.1 hypothetical protein TRFO_23287 [Tritrichomonas foetus]
MRTITFLWFWKICWNNDKPWTLVFSLMIPLVPMGIICEINRFLNTKKISYLSLLLCLALTAWVNEIILKPILAVPPLDDSCFSGCYAPSTLVAMGFASVTLYIARMLFYAPKDRFSLTGWAIAAICSFVAHPFINYLTWLYDGISIIPGVIIGILWAIFCEGKGFPVTMYKIGRMLKLENDLNGINLKEENL